MNKCEACGQEYKLGFRDRMLRSGVTRGSRKFPGLHTIIKATENYCNKCWHEVVDPATQSMYNAFTNQPQTVYPIENDKYEVTLEFQKDEVKIRHTVNLYDSTQEGMNLTKRLQNDGWTLIEVDDPYSDNPLNAVNSITSRRIPRKEKKRQIKVVEFLSKELQKNK